jgi:hypothetical protein
MNPSDVHYIGAQKKAGTLEIALRGPAEINGLPVVPVAGDFTRELDDFELRLNPRHVSLPFM